MKKLTDEQCASLRTYIKRTFDNPTENRLSQAALWLAGNEPGLLRYEWSKRDFLAAGEDDELLQTWCDARMTKLLWTRYLTSLRVAKHTAKTDVITIRIAPAAHKKLAAYAKKHCFTLSEAIIHAFGNGKTSKKSNA